MLSYIFWKFINFANIFSIMILLVFIQEGNGHKLEVGIDVIKNTREENTYKFNFTFYDGRKASSIRIVNVGRKPYDYPCYMGNSYKNTADFYMRLEPDQLFEENGFKIERIYLIIKNKAKEKQVCFKVPE